MLSRGFSSTRGSSSTTGAEQAVDEFVAKYSGRWAQMEEIPDNADVRENATKKRLLANKVLDVD